MFLLAYRGTSFKSVPKSFLSRGFLAAHYFISSPQGKVKIITAKKTRNISLKSVDHVQRSWKESSSTPKKVEGGTTTLLARVFEV